MYVNVLSSAKVSCLIVDLEVVALAAVGSAVAEDLVSTIDYSF